MSLWTQHETFLESLRQAIAGGPAGWHPSRLVFRDFWHWRDYELGFAHGRLALTGQNAGGKSSLLALTIPPLLDGDTSPIRLDPGLSRDRYVYWYLLGDETADPEQPDSFAYRARTGYLALEFRHGTTGEYLTIGMGISASRHLPRKLKDWCGFILPGHRIGRGFDVRGADQNCLGPKEFVRLVQSLAVPGPLPAFVTTERGEYRRQVNAYLFGMPDDDYEALVGMLLQARRPKLGEQSGPEEVCALLRASLPGVTPERLERVAEVVNNIETYQRNLADINRRVELVAEVDGRLHALAEMLVQDAVGQWRTASGRMGSLAARLKDARAQCQQAQEELNVLTARSLANRGRLAAIATRLEVFRDRDEANLPLRLAAEEQRVKAETERLARLAERIDQSARQLAQHDRAIQGLADRFAAAIRLLQQELGRLSRLAGGAGWPEAARALETARGDLDTLGVDEDPDQAEAVRPDPVLPAEGERLLQAYQRLLAQRRTLDGLEEEYRNQQTRMEELRRALAELTAREARAGEQAEAARQGLLEAVAAWHGASPALDLPEPQLAAVRRAIAILRATPETGYVLFAEPIRQQAQVRRRQLEQERQAQLARQVRLQLQGEEVQRQLAALQRDGLLPPRTPVRDAARAGSSAGPHQPLFRWVRFRLGIEAELAARVEAAALEAGLLDLLLLVPDAAGPGPDAWAVPAPIAGLPTLLDVLEPEAGAPAAVAQVLASVAWGETNAADRWIAGDGRWRHGLAQGQVAPWLTEPLHLIGAERRETALQARVEALRQLRSGIDGQREEAAGRLRELEGLVSTLDGEVDAFGRLPWQGLFGALNDLAQLEEQANAARARIEQAQPGLEAALARFQQAEAAYRGALGHIPAAQGLDREGLTRRTGEIGALINQWRALDERYGALAEIMRDRRTQTAWRGQARQAQAELAGEQERATEQLAGLRAGVAALAGRLQDPGVAAIRAEIEGLTNEQQDLTAGEEAGRTRQGALTAQRERAQGQIDELEPQEAGARAETQRAQEQWKQRLRLHSAMAGLAQSLDQEGPVNLQRRWPAQIDHAAAAQEIDQRRGAVQDYLNRHRDLLGDYRPAPGSGWETVVFHDDRTALDAAALLARLTARQEEYRQYIAQEEQTLYERIIYQGISEDLRRLIRQAHGFTRQVNAKLKSLHLSSGERLSLRLSTLPTEQVPGAGIGQALEQWDQGVEYLSDERREFLLGLIRAEVDRRRQEAAARGEEISYHEAIRQALDYRNWFEYQLLSHLPGAGAPTPIKKRGFGKRSTSAKAWALAVPVIAGTAARYDAATRPDCPRLIGLDEAFAGFDPNNQAAYLRFLDALGLNWFVTCPDELPYNEALSAAMAYRLELDGQLHWALPILWDGHRASEPSAQAIAEVAANAEAEGGDPA